VNYFVDAHDVETSSYMRFINTPNREEDQNVMVMECRGHIYYMTWKDIFPGTELLVFYGHEYVKAMGMDMDRYYIDPRDNPDSKDYRGPDCS